MRNNSKRFPRESNPCIVCSSLPPMWRQKFRTFKDLYQYATLPASQQFKYEMEEESRSYNLCDTSCVPASSLHFEHVAATVGVGTDYFNDKTFEKEGNQSVLFYDSIWFSHSLSTGCDCRRCMSNKFNVRSIKN
ncbi:hypothetical protein RJT34_30889 [Clitoria ternatea]|uniref:Uncharacterized protein n=1 Tax=Clitoria ternatea TaxID=43366 RepID=A0AAN9ETZ7_CLITE